MEFKGIVTVKTPEITVGANNTPKVSLILEENSEKQYKDSIMIDFVGDEKVALLDGLTEGSDITVSFNTRATEYNGRYYNNLNGWKINIEKKKPEEPVKDGGDFSKRKDKIEEDYDDLPF